MLICAVCYLSMDYEQMNQMWGIHFVPGKVLESFAFACDETKPHFWKMENLDNPGFPRMRAESNFTCQVIYIYLYSTLHLIVLSTIPYRYDRFVKTEGQLKLDKKRRLKRLLHRAKA